MPNSTEPAARANRVSSLPRPTFAPGWKWVPRWRTMISPAFTTWPPYRLTPSRCALESRPFREELAPFLCAMSRACLLPCVVQRPCRSKFVISPRQAQGSLLDAGDLDPGQLRPVALALPVARLVLELEDLDLRALLGPDDLGGHGDAGQRPGRRGDLVAVDEHERTELDRVARFTGEPVDDDDVPDGHLLLTAASADDRVHLELALSSILMAHRSAEVVDGARARWHVTDTPRVQRTQPPPQVQTGAPPHCAEGWGQAPSANAGSPLR